MGFHQTFSILFFSSSLVVLPDIELLTRKVSSSIWPEKVEILYKARKEKQLFLCLVSTAMLSPHPSIFGCYFQSLLQETQKMAQCFSMLLHTAWMRWTSHSPVMSVTSRHGLLVWRVYKQNVADLQVITVCWWTRLGHCLSSSLAMVWQAGLLASFGEESRQHKRGEQCKGSLQGEQQKKPKSN